MRHINEAARLAALALAFDVDTLTRKDAERRTGCDARALLDAEIQGNGDARGWYAVRTCERDFNLRVNFARALGMDDAARVHYWHGVITGADLHLRCESDTIRADNAETRNL